MAQDWKTLIGTPVEYQDHCDRISVEVYDCVQDPNRYAPRDRLGIIKELVGILSRGLQIHCRLPRTTYLGRVYEAMTERNKQVSWALDANEWHGLREFNIYYPTPQQPARNQDQEASPTASPVPPDKSSASSAATPPAPNSTPVAASKDAEPGNGQDSSTNGIQVPPISGPPKIEKDAPDPSIPPHSHVPSKPPKTSIPDDPSPDPANVKKSTQGRLTPEPSAKALGKRKQVDNYDDDPSQPELKRPRVRFNEDSDDDDEDPYDDADDIPAPIVKPEPEEVQIPSGSGFRIVKSREAKVAALKRVTTAVIPGSADSDSDYEDTEGIVDSEGEYADPTPPPPSLPPPRPRGSRAPSVGRRGGRTPALPRQRTPAPVRQRTPVENPTPCTTCIRYSVKCQISGGPRQRACDLCHLKKVRCSEASIKQEMMAEQKLLELLVFDAEKDCARAERNQGKVGNRKPRRASSSAPGTSAAGQSTNPIWGKLNQEKVVKPKPTRARSSAPGTSAAGLSVNTDLADFAEYIRDLETTKDFVDSFRNTLHSNNQQLSEMEYQIRLLTERNARLQDQCDVALNVGGQLFLAQHALMKQLDAERRAAGSSLGWDDSLLILLDDIRNQLCPPDTPDIQAESSGSSSATTPLPGPTPMDILANLATDAPSFPPTNTVNDQERGAAAHGSPVPPNPSSYSDNVDSTEMSNYFKFDLEGDPSNLSQYRPVESGSTQSEDFPRHRPLESSSSEATHAQCGDLSGYGDSHSTGQLPGSSLFPFPFPESNSGRNGYSHRGASSPHSNEYDFSRGGSIDLSSEDGSNYLLSDDDNDCDDGSLSRYQSPLSRSPSPYTGSSPPPSITRSPLRASPFGDFVGSPSIPIPLASHRPRGQDSPGHSEHAAITPEVGSALAVVAENEYANDVHTSAQASPTHSPHQPPSDHEVHGANSHSFNPTAEISNTPIVPALGAGRPLESPRLSPRRSAPPDGEEVDMPVSSALPPPIGSPSTNSHGGGLSASASLAARTSSGSSQPSELNPIVPAPEAGPPLESPSLSPRRSVPPEGEEVHKPVSSALPAPIGSPSKNSPQPSELNAIVQTPEAGLPSESPRLSPRRSVPPEGEEVHKPVSSALPAPIGSPSKNSPQPSELNAIVPTPETDRPLESPRLSPRRSVPPDGERVDNSVSSAPRHNPEHQPDASSTNENPLNFLSQQTSPLSSPPPSTPHRRASSRSRSAVPSRSRSESATPGTNHRNLRPRDPANNRVITTLPTIVERPNVQ